MEYKERRRNHHRRQVIYHQTPPFIKFLPVLKTFALLTSPSSLISAPTPTIPVGCFILTISSPSSSPIRARPSRDLRTTSQTKLPSTWAATPKHKPTVVGTALCNTAMESACTTTSTPST